MPVLEPANITSLLHYCQKSQSILTFLGAATFISLEAEKKLRAGRKQQGHARNQNIFVNFFFSNFFSLMPNTMTLCSHQACVVKLRLSSISFGRNAEEEMLSQEMFLFFSLIKWRDEEQVGVCSFWYIRV